MKESVRKLSTLFALVILQLEKKKDFNSMCFAIQDLVDGDYINSEERRKLDDYLHEHQPLVNSIGEPKRKDDVYYWWSPFNIEPRVKWLEEQIEKVKKENN